MKEPRNRYHIESEQFTCIEDAKFYIQKNKDKYQAHDGGYQLVPVYCGFTPVGWYKYVPDLKKVVKIS